MKRKFQYIILGLTLIKCTESTDRLSGENLYAFTDNRDFFPKEIQEKKHFNADWYSDLLKQLGEKSLADRYYGHEIIRLTAIRSFKNHFSILLVNKENEVQLTIKETYRDTRPVDNGDTTKITFDIIEFDSVTGKYFDVRKFMSIGNNPIDGEIERKPIDPLLKNETTKLKTSDWNDLTKLLKTTSFWTMQPTDSIQGFDGSHYILETHSKDGYYVVDRWSPKSGDFKTIIDYIIGLSTYEEQRN